MAAARGAILPDETVGVRARIEPRELLAGSDLVRYDLHFEHLQDQGEFGAPALSVRGLVEPIGTFRDLEKALAALVAGRSTAAQHETFEEGWALQVESEGSDRFRVELWVDLGGASQALRLRSRGKGHRQAALRFTATRAGLELFRKQLAQGVRGLLS